MNTSLQILSDFVIYTKYARYSPEKKRRETYEEIVTRNMEMHLRKFPFLEEEIRDAYRYVYEKKVLPSMRSFQFAGKAIELNPVRINNCLKKSTKFITSEGVKSFEDFEDGDEIVVLTAEGNWKPAIVKSYGKQKLNKITFSRGRYHQFEEYATPDHRWLLDNGKETTNLKIGNKIKSFPSIFEDFSYDSATPEEKLYWCYGFIYGDGTIVKNKSGNFSMVRLCGSKQRFICRFEEFGFSSTQQLSCGGDYFIYTGTYQKTPPNPEIDSPELVRAFIAGYLDADGHRVTCKETVNSFDSIQSSEKDHIEFIESCFPIAGVIPYNKKDLSERKTNFGIHKKGTSSFRIVTQISNNTSAKRFKVEAIEETGTEEVWCLEVKDDKSFVLASGISTGNCSARAIDSIEAFSEAMFILLAGCGYGVSVQKHHVKKLPPVLGPNVKGRKRRYLIADSIEGWASAVKQLCLSYFNGTQDIQFDFRDIRPKGQPLKTSGGRAPGAQPLKDCLHNIRKIFDLAIEERGRGIQLKPIEVHDIICTIADTVLAGGIRRAACISFFSFDDEEMRVAKFNGWYEKYPYRARANNSALLLRHRIKKEEFFDYFDKMWASGTGEPGFLWSNDKDTIANPSLRKGTKVLTSDGIFNIEELEGKEFYVRNLNGIFVPAKCFLSGKNKRLTKIILQSGVEYYATEEHKWPIFLNKFLTKKETKDLKKRYKLPVISEKGLGYGSLGDEKDGFLVGWLYGDGWITDRADHPVRQYGLIVSKKDADNGILEKLQDILSEKIDDSINFTERGNSFKTNFQRQSAKEYFDQFGVDHEKGLPSKIWTECSDEFRKGFIDGLFSSNGYIVQKENEQNKICLSSSRPKLINELQTLLGFYGILTRKYHYSSTGERTLIVRGAGSTFHFRECFSFSHKEKQEYLTNIKTKFDNLTYHRKIGIKSIEVTDLYEDVWDITVYDDTHTFQLSNCITGNCGEISLKASGGFCNLTTFNAEEVHNQEDLNNFSRAAAFIGTLQASYTDFHYLGDQWKENADKDALIGVSITGVASGNLESLNLIEAAEIVKKENARVAKIIGINKAARCTTLKPEGCLTSDTMLSTDKGILYLDEIGDTEGEKWQDIDFKIATDKLYEKSDKFYINGKKPTKKILLDSGIEIESTFNHKFRVLTREGDYVWKTADTLTKGDSLPYSIGEYSGGNFQYLIELNYNVSKFASRLKPIKQPTILTEDLAWFLGFYFGNGSNHQKGIRLYGNYSERKGFNRLCNIIKKNFGLKANLFQHSEKDNRGGLYINSTELLKFLEVNGLLKQKSYEIEIPMLIRCSPKSVIKAFIDGYGTADGCDKNKSSFSYCTTSEKWAKQLVIVLRAIGYDCKIRLMPPTKSSYGKKMRYWISERKGRTADKRYIKIELKEKWEQLDKLGLSNLSVDTIIDISESENNTYDIQVPKTHTYLANSYVSHNTSSILLGTSSGIHAWHNDYYVRRIRVGKEEPVHDYLKLVAPRLIEDEYFKPTLQSVLSIPVKAPEGAKLRSEPVLEFLGRVKRYNIEWVRAGHRKGNNYNNVSCTIHLRPEEVEEVKQWLWENRDFYNGITILPYDNGEYVQAPFEDIDADQYFNLSQNLEKIDFSYVFEEQDNTNLQGATACSGGVCEVK